MALTKFTKNQLQKWKSENHGYDMSLQIRDRDVVILN